MTSEIAKAWFERALILDVGSKLLIECETKTNREILIRELNDLIKSMRTYDPINASKMFVNGTFKRNRHWVEISKRSIDQTTAVEVDRDGNAKKVSIQSILTRRRQVMLMTEDGYTPDEIKEQMKLTEQEMYAFGLWERDTRM